MASRSPNGDERGDGQRRSHARTKITPPKLARRWGISPDKVLTWIRSGELRAIDVATRRGGRPRYRIDETDIAAFEASRSVISIPAKQQRRRKKQAGVFDFF